ncbi:MAG: hypothetical protein AAF899_13640 [Pseudomonadota bacterium]
MLLSVPSALGTAAAVAAMAPMAEIDAMFLAGLSAPLVWVAVLVWGLMADGAKQALQRVGGLAAASIVLTVLAASGG